MAYEKISASTGNGTIRFYYTTDSLFSEVKLLSTYRARSEKNQKGEANWDDLSITNSEEDFFLKFLGYVVPEVFGYLSKIAHGVVDSVFVDEGSTNSETGFSLVSYDAYDDNLLTVIDAKIRECFIAYILSKWWFLTPYNQIAADYMTLYLKSLLEMKDKAWSLIKPLVV